MTDKVNFKVFEEPFDQVGHNMQQKLIMSFLKEVDGVKLWPMAITHTLENHENYNDALVYTHKALYQKLILTKRGKFSK